MSQAETFHNRFEAGEEHALEQASAASEHSYVIPDESGRSLQDQWLAAAKSMQAGTSSTRYEFNDQSYLVVNRVNGEVESTEWGMTKNAE